MSEPNKTLSAEDIARLRELAGKATKGPWKPLSNDERHSADSIPVMARDGYEVCEVAGWATSARRSMTIEEAETNAAFIASSREAVPALIAAWEDHVEALAAALTLVTIRTADMGEALTRATSAAEQAEAERDEAREHQRIVEGFRQDNLRMAQEAVVQRDEARAHAGELEAALKRSITAIDDWLHQYAGEMCDAKAVEESGRRIMAGGGTLYYIATVQKQNREALGEQSS